MIIRNKVFLAVLLMTICAALLINGDAWAGKKHRAQAPAVTTVGAIQYLDDGAVHSGTGAWTLPAQGTCPADVTKTTRPDCVALRIVAADQTSCTAANGSWTTSGVCNDLVNNTQSLCQAQPDRLWNSGTGVCAIIMKNADRNNVTCALERGNWVTTGTCTGSWVMPARTAYTPNLLTGNGPGDQCLRCHNSVTQYNGAAVRWVEKFMQTGHKNMARYVTPGTPLVGPDGTAYPSDDAFNPINWTTGKITIASTGKQFDLKWIYGDWLSPLPRSIYKGDRPGTCSNPAYTTESDCVANGGTWTVTGAAMSYSCGRCHTVGWTSDATRAAQNTTDPRLTKQPEGVFPGISYDTVAKTGWINLKGSVSGDTKTFSSWNVWGIDCSRCHSSSIDTGTGTGTPLQYSSPTGMTSHASALTSVDYPGTCTVSGKRDRPTCEAAGGVWNYGYCSDSRFSAKAQCEDATLYWPTMGAPGVPVGTWFTPCSNNLYGNQAACIANGGTWTEPVSSCSVAGVCNNSDYTDQPTCEANGGQWAAVTDVVRCIDAGGKWTGSMTQRGQIITALCMNCHRQETSGMPNDSGSDPAGLLQVGPSHGNIGFTSHAGGNQFLNSPHAKFAGTFSQIATAPHSYTPNAAGTYGSYFIMDGEAGNTGNGCTGCHNIHESTVAETGHTGAFKEECQECHAKDLSKMKHPTGMGTPIEDPSKPFEACITCHMPGGMHLFRINASNSYSTYPLAAMSGNAYANQQTDESGYTRAVWVDVDLACGQCHGGGTSTITTTGTVAANSDMVTVPGNSTSFVPGERVRVTGAGASGANFDTYIRAIPNSNTVQLAGPATTTVTNAAVITNPTTEYAPYFTKSQESAYANGIHNDAPVASFTYTLGNPNTLQANFNGSGSICNGSCDAYDWNFGDGTAHGSGATTSHTYAAAGTYSVTLTVEQYGVGSGSITKSVRVYTPDPPPVAGGTCTFTANTWVETLVDNSSADTVFVSVNWGDGTVVSNGSRGQTFVHNYTKVGTFTITHKAVDAAGQVGIQYCYASPNYFTAAGTVFKLGGTVPLGGAMVKYVSGGFSKIAYTATNGTYLVTGLKPGTYDVYVTKYGYIFNTPAITGLVIGPSATGQNVTAVGP